MGHPPSSRARTAARPTLVEIRFRHDAASPYYLLAKRPHVQLCTSDGGLEVALRVDADLDALTRYWLGETSWDRLLRAGAARLTGATALRRAFPTWFTGYLLRPGPGALPGSASPQPAVTSASQGHEASGHGRDLP